MIQYFPEGFVYSNNSIVTSLTNAERTIIINITQYYDGSRIGVKFNFHHNLPNANAAQAVIKEENGYKNFYNSFIVANGMINQMYGDSTNDVEW